MKKIITLIGCVALAASALAEEPVSANIVGYTKIKLDKDWTIIGVNFEDVGGGTISLQDAIPYAEGMTLGNSSTAADSIQIQNSSGSYDIYYISNGKDAKGTVAGLAGKWSPDGKYEVATNRVSAGQAMWYQAKAPSPSKYITVVGQVLLSGDGPIPVNLAVKHIANPYATDIPLNNGIPYTVGMTSGNSSTGADSIQVQNSNGSYDIYYMSNGKDAKGTVSGLEGKWSPDGKYEVATNAIPIGKGAWYMRKGSANFTITVQRPFSVQ